MTGGSGTVPDSWARLHEWSCLVSITREGPTYPVSPAALCLPFSAYLGFLDPMLIPGWGMGKSGAATCCLLVVQESFFLFILFLALLLQLLLEPHVLTTSESEKLFPGG